MKKFYLLLTSLLTITTFDASAQDALTKAYPKLAFHQAMRQPAFQQFGYRQATLQGGLLFPDEIDDLKAAQKARRKQLWSGVGYGFLPGGVLGFVFGAFGNNWVLDDGTIVPRSIHIPVDMIIFATPSTIMGTVIGLRQDKSTLYATKWHLAAAGGYSTTMTFSDMRRAFNDSGFDGHAPHWFGYLHYPMGDERSVPYTWNTTIDYNIQPHFSIGLTVNKVAKQRMFDEIISPDNHLTYDPDKQVMEFARGTVYAFTADYIINPITPQNKGRLEFAHGGGVSYSVYTVGGHLNTPNTDYKVQRFGWAPYARTTMDYYARKNLSLQAKVSYKFPQGIDVPEQTDGTTTLVAHHVNFSAVDFTVGIRYHLVKASKDED